MIGSVAVTPMNMVMTEPDLIAVPPSHLLACVDRNPLEPEVMPVPFLWSEPDVKPVPEIFMKSCDWKCHCDAHEHGGDRAGIDPRAAKSLACLCR